MEGLFVPQFTAFNKSQKVDYVATKEHGSWLLENGATGLVPFGTFGEGSSLSLSEKKRITGDLLNIVNGKILIPTVISNSLDEITEYIEFANDLPVHAIMVAPPSYFRPISDSQLIEFFRHICAKSTHPIIAYNIPATAIKISSYVASSIPVWGVKDSSGDLKSAEEFLDKNVKVMIGSDRLFLDALEKGASGGICGFANIFPERMALVFREFSSGRKFEAAGELNSVLNFTSIFLKPEYSAGEAIAVVKALANLLNPIPLGEVRLPTANFVLTDEQKTLLLRKIMA